MKVMKLLSQSLMARDFNHEVTELQGRIAALNGETALGVSVTEPVGQVRLGKGDVRPSASFVRRGT